MFGCLPPDGPHREGGLLAGLRTCLPLRSHNLDATIFWFRAPNFGGPAPAASPILRANLQLVPRQVLICSMEPLFMTTTRRLIQGS